MTKSGSADGSAKGRGKRGRPFAKGNATAWKPGQSGNPAGPKPINRPFLDKIRKFYVEHPERIDELIVVLHRGALGTRRIRPAQILAFKELVRRADVEHQRDDGTDRSLILEGIELVVDPSRPPERRKLRSTEPAALPPREMPFDDGREAFNGNGHTKE